MAVAQGLVSALELYFVAGLIFAIVFVIAGVQRVDHTAAGAGIGFRLIIFPGVAALWPLLLTRWLRIFRRQK